MPYSIKKSPSKVAEKLETVDISDVEILASGTWHGNKDITIKKEDIAQFVTSFDELASTTDEEIAAWYYEL